MKTRVILLLVMTCILISSCVTEKKARRWAYENKGKLAEWCADCFPVKESDFVPGTPEIQIEIDTIYSDPVIIEVDCPDGTRVNAECPPNRTIRTRTTVTITNKVLIRDTANERVLMDESKEAKRDLEKMTESRNGWRQWFFWSLIANGAFLLIFWLKK